MHKHSPATLPLLSRLQFMIDIAAGMQFVSSKGVKKVIRVRVRVRVRVRACVCVCVLTPIYLHVWMRM